MMNKAIFIFFFFVATLAVAVNARFCAKPDGNCYVKESIDSNKNVTQEDLQKVPCETDSQCPEGSKCLDDCKEDGSRVRKGAKIPVPPFLRWGK